jgi:hypothetical protein
VKLTKALLAINTTVIGLFAVSFARGPYASGEQALWYRSYSLAFLLAGVLLPAGLVFLRPRLTRCLGVAVNIWLIASVLAFMAYALASGGGV